MALFVLVKNLSIETKVRRRRRLITLRTKLSCAVYCCRSCLCVCIARAVSEPYYSQHARSAPCGLRGCKNGPAPFPGRMSYKATKPGLVFVLYLSMFLLC